MEYSIDTRSVLIVDDEEKILNALRRSLVEQPFNVFFANSGNEAIELLKNQDIHVVATDLFMPDINGLKLLQFIKNQYPQIVRIIFSGHTQINHLLKAINQGEIYRYIPKPWQSDDEIVSILTQAIEYYNLHTEREMLMAFIEQVIDTNKPDESNYSTVKALIEMRKKQMQNWNEAVKNKK